MSTPLPSLFDELLLQITGIDNLLKMRQGELAKIESDILLERLQKTYLTLHNQSMAANINVAHQPIATPAEPAVATPATAPAEPIKPIETIAATPVTPVVPDTKNAPSAPDANKATKKTIAHSEIEERPLFAPEESPEMPPAMAPQMDEIEGNPFQSIFEQTPTKESAQQTAAPKATASTTTKKTATPKVETSPITKVATAPKEATPTIQTAKQEEQDTTPKSTALAPKTKAATQTTTQSNTTAESKTVLGERLSSGITIDRQLGNRASTSRITDLRAAININDKFSFMSVLFHNNMKAYNDFILRLNATADRASAMEIVQLSAEEYNWDMESTEVKNFFSIFDRKF